MPSNEELIYLYRQGNDEAYELLQERFLPHMLSVVRQVGAGLGNLGFDGTEALQVCYMCLHQCVYYYCESKNASFSTYFYMRMNYGLINYRKKILTRLTRESAMDGLNEEMVYEIENENQIFRLDPVKMLDYSDEVERLLEIKEAGNAIESQVAECLLYGENSREMSKQLSLESKSINNALYRIRKKMRISQH